MTKTQTIVDEYQTALGRQLTQSAKEGLGYLIDVLAPAAQCAVDVQCLAYILATTEHEVGGTWLPIEERGNPDYFTKYETGRLRTMLGNIQRGDGIRYKGRGYCQITGRNNYKKFAELLKIPLEDAPHLALSRTYALTIMVLGMNKGLFTGKKLSDYIKVGLCDYVNARRIINGDVATNGAKISSYATRWEKILQKQLQSN